MFRDLTSLSLTRVKGLGILKQKSLPEHSPLPLAREDVDAF
jgi:hypothetical protein